MYTRKKSSKRKRNDDRRSGVVTVEMAICLPVMFMLFLGSIDLIRYNLLRNVVSQATYEGCRTALVRGATTAEINDVVENTIATYDPDLSYTLTMNPTSLDTNSDTITLTLTADIRAAGWIVSKQILGSTMVETMTVERD